MKKIVTLIVAQRGDEILIGTKKRGYGAGLLNCMGGKVEHGETYEEAAKREFFEECKATCDKLEKRGEITYTFASDAPSIEMHIFHTNTVKGTPEETEEMSPKWVHMKKMPYQQMWPDSKQWMPKFFEGKCLSGYFHYDEEERTILKSSLEEVDADMFAC